MRVFENYESEVRGYIRSFPTIFKSAKDAILVNEQDEEFIDFFAGAGTLNYGHNNEQISQAMISYLQNDGVVHGMDMATTAKKAFMHAFQETILKPRNLDYKMQFTGPTGTNAVETALKLVRMVKGRSNVISFTNGFHGLTQGSLSISANDHFRDESYISRTNATFMPYDGYFGEGVDTLAYLRKFLSDSSSGVDTPAAIIVETVQGDGGINVASKTWLQGLERICREFDILFVIDDIQVGNGRTGEFFSFEFAGVKPDIVTLSKSVGAGLPMALLLFRPELDQWKPGEHTGTFRGNNLAFVAAKTAIEKYWQDDRFMKETLRKGQMIRGRLEAIRDKYPTQDIDVRGRGMAQAFEIRSDFSVAGAISKAAFSNGLIIETCGSEDQVVKFIPPLTIDDETLGKGLDIFEEAVESVLADITQQEGE
jgi:diaminobutyrate-2-oxoglutarate transaminase